jgi:hypothetical protein
MSILVMSAVWEKAENVKGTDLLVLLSLADHADSEGWCYPSVSRLAKMARVGERAVQLSLRALEEMGYLETIPRVQKTSVYRIRIDNMQGCILFTGRSSDHHGGDPAITLRVNERSPDPSFNHQVTKEDPPMSETATGNTAPEDTPPLQKPDPLEPFPSLAAAYPRIIKEILRSHPKARFPASGTKGDYDARLVLSQLVRVDGFTEDEILETFGWVFLVERPSPSGFSWREQFQSIAQLRNKKTGDTMHKFAKMHEAAKKAIDSPPKPAPGEDLPEYIRDAMRAAGKL